MSDSKKEFGKIYDQYIEKIYRFIFLKVNTKEIAEDLTSEVFLRCWKAYQASSNEIQNIQAFLYQIARNLIIDHYRAKGRTQFVSVDETPIIDSSFSIEEKSFIDSDLNNVKFALSKINDDYKEVIIWHYVDDLPIVDIAKITNKSEGAVRVMLHRALESLKKEVKEA